MKAKIPLLVGGAVGYVLGTRAGRERYEQIKSQAQAVWNNPKVQEGAQKGAWAAQDFATEKAPVLKDKLGDSGPDASGSPSGSVSGGGFSSSDPVAATTATGMSATDPLGSETGLGGDLDTGLDSGTGLGGDLDADLDTGTDPLSSTPDDRAPFPSSGSGL